MRRLRTYRLYRDRNGCGRWGYASALFNSNSSSLLRGNLEITANSFTSEPYICDRLNDTAHDRAQTFQVFNACKTQAHNYVR
jgi:hypothetical protein